MKCLKCGKDTVLHTNAHGVSEGGGCSISCTACGQSHDANLMFNTDMVSLPLPLWQNALIYGCIVAALAAMYGIYHVTTLLL